eukprot:TRINITY_DN31835_c0_g1_i1.p1 TRINITY_DN31835_c0_g1~~TRINITY_DN31835_c0_g1_i1.p1  ORF type:complete len:530 (-),score=57.04 TRINITY_DN31835_c0_g1_i1:84-1595(-)
MGALKRPSCALSATCTAPRADKSRDAGEQRRRFANKACIHTGPASGDTGDIGVQAPLGTEVFSTAASDRLRQSLRKPVERGQWPGLAARVFVDGRLAFDESVGFADVESKVPMSDSSLVRLYSMTKCVVGAAVMKLVDDGKLGLDDTLATHLPAFESVKVLAEGPDGLPQWDCLEAPQQPIRIRHLLTHTSGISCGISAGIDGPVTRGARERAWASVYSDLTSRMDNGEIGSLAEWVDELSKLPLVAHPGAEYGYGYSYDVLGRLVELRSGCSLESFLKSNIFDPLDMIDTRFDLDGESPCGPLSKRLSALYRRTKSSHFGSDGRAMRLVRVDPPEQGAASLWSPRCRVPAGGGAVTSLEGGLLSTLRDYSTFLLTCCSGGVHPSTGVRILSTSAAALLFADLTASLGPRPQNSTPWARCPYGDRGLGLACLGEVQREGLAKTKWFDGVPGVRQWGGAASTAFKIDPNGGRPILVVLMTQVLPQDDGAVITALLEGARAALNS